MSKVQRLTWMSLIFLPLVAVGIALISQHVYDMLPCAWCVLQRLVLLLVSLVSTIAFFLRGSKLYSRILLSISSLLAMTGIGTSLYQHLEASSSTTCMVDFASQFMSAIYLEANVPWLFGIYVNCSDAAVTLLGVYYDVWAALCFVVLLLASGYLVWRPQSPSIFK